MAAEEETEFGKKAEAAPSPYLKMTKEQLRKEIREKQRKMQAAAKELDFLAAAKFRDEIKEMQTLLETAR
jgi:excinuclease ABC subunit B